MWVWSSNGDASSSIQGLQDHSVVDSLDSFYQLPIKAKISTILSLHTSRSYQLVGDTNDKAMIRPVSDNKNTNIQNRFCFSIRVCPIRINIFNIFHLIFVINECVSSDSSNSINDPMKKIRFVQSLDSQPLYFSVSPPAQGSATL